ncbi:MAG: LysR family transcriptional regulator [Pseudomonadota bacterium]
MPEPLLKWDDFRVFLAMVREKRLASAGRVLSLDPATVGRRINALEDALGAQLFLRSPHGYTLTEAGRSLVEHARAIEGHAAAATADLGSTHELLSGAVRIGAPDGVATYLLVEACDALSKGNPSLRVQLMSLPRLFSLSKREADLAITLAPPPAGRLTVRKISDYHLHLYARPELIAAVGQILTLDDLRNVRGIGYISDLVLDRELDYFALLGREAEPALTSNNLLIQLGWCLKGAGFCFLPDFVGRAHSEITPVLVDEVKLTRSLYLVRHEDDARVARINRMADFIVEWIRDSLSQSVELRQPALS